MKKLFIVVLTLVAAISCCFGLAACNNKPKLIGYDIDLATAVGEQLGVKVVFQEIQWNQKEVELNSKSIDLIWNGMTITDERQDSMSISVPYMQNKQVALIRKADAETYTTVDSMKGADVKIIAEDGSAGEECARGQIYGESGAEIAATEQIKHAGFIEAANMISILTELNAGTADVGIMDSVMAGYYMSTDSNFSSKLQIVSGLSLAEEEYGIAARKDGGLGTIYQVNAALAALKANGKMDSIATTYGLSDVILDCAWTSSYDTLAAADKADWEYIQGKGTLIIGYTLFAPIAYTAE